MIRPQLHFDAKTKIISLALQKRISQESQFHRRVIFDFDQNNEMIRLWLLPFSLDDFGEGEKEQISFSRQPKVSLGIVGSSS